MHINRGPARWLLWNSPLEEHSFGGHPIWAALEIEIVHVERKYVVEAEVVVLVHAGVVIILLGAGVQRDFTSGHVPCHDLACL